MMFHNTCRRHYSHSPIISGKATRTPPTCWMANSMPFVYNPSAPAKHTPIVVPAITRCWLALGAATIPILLITTSGADPGKEMEELAEKTVGRGRYDARRRTRNTSKNRTDVSHQRIMRSLRGGVSTCMTRPGDMSIFRKYAYSSCMSDVTAL